MKTKTFVIAILFILNLENYKSFSQITQYSAPFTGETNKVPAYVVHVQPKLAEKVGEIRHLKKLQFAEVVEMDISPETHGQWIRYGDKKIWRQKIISPDAYSLNLTFSKFRLEKGVSLLVYNPSKTDILGALTYLNNKPDRTLAIRPIKGDTLIIEMQVPLQMNSYGELKISRLGHDFMNIYDILKDGLFDRSGDCNVDVACSEDEKISTLKNSVCRIIFNNRELCTGTIVNNTIQNGKPYIMTANHCLSDEETAESAVFIFDYQSPFCNGPDGSVSKSISGSKLIATAKKIDFSLVELSENIPVNYNPYFAGWNATEDYNDLSETFSIHHPWGDVKKISVDDDPPISESYSSYYVDESHWRIQDWEEGTTERGSSGGGLFDANYRLIGDLTGGEADCYTPVNDYYSKMSKAWDFYSDTSMQLEYWLDPLKTGAKKIDGYDPNIDFKESCGKLSNYKSGEVITLEEIDGSKGYYSGHNEYYITQYAEKFVSENEVVLSGIFLNIAKLVSENPSNSKLKIKLWNGDISPEEVISEKTYLFDQLAERDMFLEFDHLLNLQGTFFIGYEISYSNKTDTFALYHTYTDAVQKNNSNTTFAFVNGEWKSLAEQFNWDFTSSLALCPYLCGDIDYEKLPSQEVIEPIVFPNPASNFFQIDFQNTLIKLVDVKIYNLSGNLVLSENFTTGDLFHEINLAKFNEGLYLCKIIVNQQEYHKKLIVTK